MSFVVHAGHTGAPGLPFASPLGFITSPHQRDESRSDAVPARPCCAIPIGANSPSCCPPDIDQKQAINDLRPVHWVAIRVAGRQFVNRPAGPTVSAARNRSPRCAWPLPTTRGHPPHDRASLIDLKPSRSTKISVTVAPFCVRRGQCGRDTLFQRRPVMQAGELVVHSPPAQLRLSRDARADVLDQRHDRCHLTVRVGQR